MKKNTRRKKGGRALTLKAKKSGLKKVSKRRTGKKSGLKKVSKRRTSKKSGLKKASKRRTGKKSGPKKTSRQTGKRATKRIPNEVTVTQKEVEAFRKQITDLFPELQEDTVRCKKHKGESKECRSDNCYYNYDWEECFPRMRKEQSSQLQ